MIRTFIAITMLLFLGANQPAIASNCSKHSTSLAGKASNAGIFKTHLAAAEAANLKSTLYNEGPFTLFAPTDAAFGALADGTFENLLKSPPELAKVIKYHLVRGNVFSGDLSSGSSISTVLGSSVVIKKSDAVFVNSAKVIQADIEASNGVIHVIDKVLLPTI